MKVAIFLLDFEVFMSIFVIVVGGGRGISQAEEYFNTIPDQ